VKRGQHLPKGDKSEVLWRTCWGTHWELGEPGERRTTFAKAYEIKNEVLLGTLWEHVKNLGTLSFDPLVPWPIRH
jgi:hypothetical protein